MTTLTEFLLARIAEDEGQAQRQVRRVKAARDADVYLWPRGSLLVADSETTAVFSGAWRVLAECEAKRRLLKMHEITGEPEEQWLDSGIYGATGRTVYGCGDCDLAEDNMEQWYVWHHRPVPGCETLLLLALPYADHLDYRQEWKP